MGVGRETLAGAGSGYPAPPPSTRGPRASTTGPEPPNAGHRHRRPTRDLGPPAFSGCLPGRSRVDLGPGVPARFGLGWD